MRENAQDTVMVSLIVATLGRTEELEHLLASVARQSFRNVEVIVVDQNEDDRLKAAVECWQGELRCRRVRSRRGLSQARNAGIRLAVGNILGFPDDDCWYPEDFLYQVNNWFEQHPAYGFLGCAAQDETGREVASRWPKRSGAIDRSSILRACASASMFVRKSVLDEVGDFNEQLGLGAATPFQSGEDSDLALRCLAAGYKGWFEKHLYIHHPYKGSEVGSSGARARLYGLGFGWLLRRHGYRAHTLIYHVFRALGGAIRSVLLAQPSTAHFYWNSALGRLRGYLMPGGVQPTTK